MQIREVRLFAVTYDEGGADFYAFTAAADNRFQAQALAEQHLAEEGIKVDGLKLAVEPIAQGTPLSFRPIRTFG